MKRIVHSQYRNWTDQLTQIVENFDTLGDQLGEAQRNVIKTFILDGKKINIKSFKIPNVINQIVYRFFRKSKAQRSFEYANILCKLNIGTPQPIAYYEFASAFFLKKSFYMSEHLEYDITYRELTTDFNYPNYDEILRAFTRFTFKLHEKNILFLDHSPGNTLIKKVSDGYEFYLVDLNRMVFKSLNTDERIKNFSRLTIHESMVRTMSDEYAKCIDESPDKVFELMWHYTNVFQAKFHRKRRLKQKLKFWKNYN